MYKAEWLYTVAVKCVIAPGELGLHPLNMALRSYSEQREDFYCEWSEGVIIFELGINNSAEVWLLKQSQPLRFFLSMRRGKKI